MLKNTINVNLDPLTFSLSLVDDTIAGLLVGAILFCILICLILGGLRLIPVDGAVFILKFIREQGRGGSDRSEEHTSELQSLMRISYAVFCLKKKIHKNRRTQQQQNTVKLRE